MAKWLRAVLLLSPLAALVLVLVVLGVGALLPSSYEVAESAVYREPPAVVWAVVSDLAALPAWDPLVHGIERLPDRGGRPVWRERTGDGTVTYEVVQAVSPRRLVLAVLANDAPFRGTWTFDLAPGPPAESGSRLTLTARGRIESPFFRFLLRFVYGSDRALDIYLTALGRRLGETVQPVRVLPVSARLWERILDTAREHATLLAEGR